MLQSDNEFGSTSIRSESALQFNTMICATIAFEQYAVGHTVMPQCDFSIIFNKATWNAAIRKWMTSQQLGEMSEH
jgi:hypothetical protein